MVFPVNAAAADAEKYGALTTRISKVLNYNFGPRFCHPSNDDGRGDSSIQIYPPR